MAKDTPDKGLLSKIYKDLKNSVIRKQKLQLRNGPKALINTTLMKI